MKNGIVLILALILSLSLAACDKRTSDAPGATTTPTAPASSASVVSSETTAPTMTTAPAPSTNAVPSETTVPPMTTAPPSSTSVVPSKTTVTPKPTTPASSTNTTPSKTTVPTATTAPTAIPTTAPTRVPVILATTAPIKPTAAPTTPSFFNPNTITWVTNPFYTPTAPTTVPTATTVPTSLTSTTPSETDPADETIPGAPKLKDFRVVGKKEDGIILHIGYTDGLEEIYAYVKTDFKAKAFDTVYMKYYEGDIKKQNGKFMYEIGRPEEREYTYVLENVVNIRFPVAGEATFG